MRTQLFPLGTLDQTNQKFGLNFSTEKVPKFGNATLLSTLNWPPFLGAHLDCDWWKYCHFFFSHVFLSKWATFSPWLNQLGVCTSDFSCMSSLLTPILAKTLSLYLFARNGNILAKISHSAEGGWVRGYSWHQCHHGQNKQSLWISHGMMWRREKQSRVSQTHLSEDTWQINPYCGKMDIVKW